MCAAGLAARDRHSLTLRRALEQDNKGLVQPETDNSRAVDSFRSRWR
jgi:hypothetical protein